MMLTVSTGLFSTSVALAAALLLAGCSDDESGHVVDAGDTTVLVAEPDAYAADAALKNHLEVIGGCLGIHPNVVIWPSGTEVIDEDPLTIDVPGYGRFTLGDVVEVGGNRVVGAAKKNTQLEDHKVAGVTIPAKCTATGVWLANPSP